MTYEEYSTALTFKLTLTKQKTFVMFNTLKGSKGYLDTREQRLYLAKVAEFLSIANQCESLLNLFLEGKVNPFDEMINPFKDIINQSDRIKRTESIHFNN
ncbi:MAG: hypothetical protein JWR67_741 [Mucilaginibacter sp.]|nr:hypothetical protein [Mucilaginibacter sp.]